MQITQVFMVDTANITDGAVTIAKLNSATTTDTPSSTNQVATANYAMQQALLNGDLSL